MTWVAVAEVELRATEIPLTDVAIVSVKGNETAAVSDDVERVRWSVPALALLRTPSTVTATGSPAPTWMPVVIVTEFEAEDTVAVRHPCD